MEDRKIIEVNIVNKLNDFIFKLPTFSEQDLDIIYKNLTTLLDVPSDVFEDESMEEFDRPLILRKTLNIDNETIKTLFLGYTIKKLCLEKEKEER